MWALWTPSLSSCCCFEVIRAFCDYVEPSYVDGPDWQAGIYVLIHLVGCGHMSGL